MSDIDDEFICEKEEGNDCDSYAVAVVGGKHDDIKAMIFHGSTIYT